MWLSELRWWFHCSPTKPSHFNTTRLGEQLQRGSFFQKSKCSTSSSDWFSDYRRRDVRNSVSRHLTCRPVVGVFSGLYLLFFLFLIREEIIAWDLGKIMFFISCVPCSLWVATITSAGHFLCIAGHGWKCSWSEWWKHCTNCITCWILGDSLWNAATRTLVTHRRERMLMFGGLDEKKEFKKAEVKDFSRSVGAQSDQVSVN